MKDLKSGAKIFERINSGNNVEVVEVQSRNLQFLYSEDKILNLMDPETFEEVALSGDLISAPSGLKAIPFLQPPVRSNSSESSSSFRNATLENGCVVSVPDFVKEGDTVLLDLSSLAYRERVKEPSA